MRFAKIQEKKAAQLKKFNLDGSNLDTLTHFGKPINQISMLNDDISDDEEVYEDNRQFISEMSNSTMNKKDLLKKMIMETKIKKEERKQSKIANFHRAEALNESFNEIALLLKKRPKEFTKARTEYDDMVDKMQYEDKTKPVDRVKSKEEIEYEKMLKIERRRKEADDSSDEEEEEEDKKTTQKEKILTKREKRLAELKKAEEEEADLSGEDEDDDEEEEEDDEEGEDEEEEEGEEGDFDEEEEEEEEEEEGEDESS